MKTNDSDMDISRNSIDGNDSNNNCSNLSMENSNENVLLLKEHELKLEKQTRKLIEIWKLINWSKNGIGRDSTYDRGIPILILILRKWKRRIEMLTKYKNDMENTKDKWNKERDQLKMRNEALRKEYQVLKSHKLK